MRPIALLIATLVMSLYLVTAGAWLAVAFGWLVLLPLGFVIASGR